MIVIELQWKEIEQDSLKRGYFCPIIKEEIMNCRGLFNNCQECPFYIGYNS